jgi:hypothetical protein
MLDSAFNLVQDSLNKHLLGKFNLKEDVVVISGLSSQDGSASGGRMNKLILSLVNVEIRQGMTSNAMFRNRDSSAVKKEPEMNTEVCFMIAANFAPENYSEALRYISETMTYFHVNRIFDQKNTPDMTDNMSKLMIEVHNRNIEETSQIWQMIGAEYMPSVAYRMTVVSSLD